MQFVISFQAMFVSFMGNGNRRPKKEEKKVIVVVVSVDLSGSFPPERERERNSEKEDSEVRK